MSDKYDHLPVEPDRLAELLEEAHRDVESDTEPNEILLWSARHPAEAD